MTWEPVGLIILAVVPYLRCLDGEFLLDDPAIWEDGPPATVYRRPRSFHHDQRSMVHLLDSFLWRLFGIGGTGKDSSGVRIIQPSWPWHALSLAFHAGTTLAVWGLLALFLEPWRALTGAAIFAVHPLQVQPVGYISGRAGVQAVFFSALGLLHAAAGGWHWAAVPACQYFAYKSKPDGLLYVVLYPLILWRIS